MRSAAKAAYNRLVRPHLPRKIAVFNGVAVRDVRLLDATDVFPDYEGALIGAIRARVDPGDDVVIVGGGRGVSSVVAARRTGDEGRVVTFEGSAIRAELVEETAGLNEVDDTVSVRHSVVGTALELATDPGGAEPTRPDELPDCDVLILDCEGTEAEILAEFGSAPRAIVVETHGFLDVPEAEVRELLTDRGYAVTNRRIENESDGIFVLTALSGAA